jgi:hypothetical protein
MMILNSLDRSYYFKGMLLLVKKDDKISLEEKELLMRIGSLLRFNQQFCEQTINDLLQNEHITEFPLEFSNKEFAEIFLKDAIKIAFSDHSLHIKEYNWLRQIARTNKIDDHWLLAELSIFMNNNDLNQEISFEIQKYYKKKQVPSHGI